LNEFKDVKRREMSKLKSTDESLVALEVERFTGEEKVAIFKNRF
jgi:hypothetical protein